MQRVRCARKKECDVLSLLGVGGQTVHVRPSVGSTKVTYARFLG